MSLSFAKRAGVIVLSLACASGGASGQSDGRTAGLGQGGAPAPGELASLVFDGGDPEFAGERPVGSAVLRKVYFANPGPDPVRVRIVSKSCSCLGARFDREVVPPGERVELTIGAEVIPAAGELRYFVEFEAARQGEPAPEPERGVVFLRVFPDVSLVARPQGAGVGGIVGMPMRFLVSVRAMDGDPAPVRGLRPTFSLPGFAAALAPSAAIGPPHVAWAAVEGRPGAAGLHKGKIEWVPQDGPSVAEVPVRVFVAPRLRAFPGGAVFAGAERGTERVVTLHLVGVAGDERPARAEVTPRTAGFGAAISGNRLTITMSADADRPGRGHGFCRLMDARGDEILRVPVVWWE